MPNAGTVVGLWRYAVKSMLGEELDATDVTPQGLVGDRQFAVVDRETGKIAGAKNPRKWPDFFGFRAAYVEPPAAGSTLPAVRVTLPDGTAVSNDDPSVSEVLSAAFGREVELARPRHGWRVVAQLAEEYWPDLEGLAHRDTVTEWELPAGTFFDLATVHLLTTASIRRLQELYPEGRLDVQRFRPNIVVETGADAHGFVEDDWVGRTVAIGDDVRLRVTGPCHRCVMITLAQGDLPRDAGLLRAAAEHNQANLGVYADVVAGGAVRRGDPVTLV